MRREIERIHLSTFTGPADSYRQRTELPKPARALLAKLNIDPPRKVHELTPAKLTPAPRPGRACLETCPNARHAVIPAVQNYNRHWVCQVNGSVALSVVTDRSLSRGESDSRVKPARPYICLLIILSWC